MGTQNLTEEQEFQILSLVSNFTNIILGVDYLMNRYKLKNDPILYPIYESIANNIQSPLTEWNERFAKN
jgi:hypothetical protein